MQPKTSEKAVVNTAGARTLTDVRLPGTPVLLRIRLLRIRETRWDEHRQCKKGSATICAAVQCLTWSSGPYSNTVRALRCNLMSSPLESTYDVITMYRCERDCAKGAGCGGRARAVLGYFVPWQP